MQGAFRAAIHAEPQRMTGVLYLCRTTSVMAAVEAARRRIPPELDLPELLFAIGDFDEQWQQFLTERRAVREARKANRHARTVLHISKEAS